MPATPDTLPPGLAASDLICPTVPGRYQAATLDGYHPATPTQTEALAAARDVSHRLTGETRRRASLVLLGTPGVGKSHLAAAICHAVTADLMVPWRIEANRANDEYDAALARSVGHAPTWNDRPVVRRVPRPTLPEWVNVPSLVVDVKAEMHLPDDEQQRTTFARSLRSLRTLVVLDDLGRERISEWTGELLYVVVNDRYEAGLPTIATSNLTVEELVAAGYWPAISRLAEDGRLIEVKAHDHRLRRTA